MCIYAQLGSLMNTNSAEAASCQRPQVTCGVIANEMVAYSTSCAKQLCS
jgi:hypothetical protein